MPNKDILKRREAYKRWASKNKEKRKEYQRILWKARKANPIKQKCSVTGCLNLGERHHDDYSKPEQITWVCRSHHKPEKHKGVCGLCGGVVLARGFCNKHYKSERKRTDPLYAEKERLQKHNPCPMN